MLIAAYTAYSFIFKTSQRGNAQPEHETGIKQTNNGSETSTTSETSLTWNYGSMLKGTTDTVVLPLNSEKTGAGRLGYGKTSNTRNYLFLNTSSKEQHWLLDHNDFAFLHREAVSGPKGTMFKYEFAKQDTNEDGKYSSEDKITLAFSTADGLRFTELIDEIDEVLGSRAVGNGKLLFIYRKNGETISSIIRTNDISIETKRPLPLISK